MTNRDRLDLFSRNLNTLIERSGKQQKEIAFDLDIPVTTINNWCTAKAMPRYGMLERLAAYFKRPVTQILETDLNDPRARLSSVIHELSDAEIEQIITYVAFIKENRTIER